MIVLNKYTTVALVLLVFGILCLLVGFAIERGSTTGGIVCIATGIVAIIVSSVFYVFYRLPESRPFSKK